MVNIADTIPFTSRFVGATRWVARENAGTIKGVSAKRPYITYFIWEFAENFSVIGVLGGKNKLARLLCSLSSSALTFHRNYVIISNE